MKKYQESLEEALITADEKRTKLILSEGQKGHFVQLMPGYAAKAIKKLGPGVNDVNGNMSFVFANALEPVSKALLAVADYENILNEKQKETKNCRNHLRNFLPLFIKYQRANLCLKKILQR